MKAAVSPQTNIYVFSVAGTLLHLGPSAAKLSMDLSP